MRFTKRNPQHGSVQCLSVQPQSSSQSPMMQLQSNSPSSLHMDLTSNRVVPTLAQLFPIQADCNSLETIPEKSNMKHAITCIKRRCLSQNSLVIGLQSFTLSVQNKILDCVLGSNYIHLMEPNHLKAYRTLLKYLLPEPSKSMKDPNKNDL